MSTRTLLWAFALVAVLWVLAAVLVTVSGAGAHLPQDNPPDPQPLPPTGIPWLDNIYYGAIPAQKPDGPVLVFVHGYGGVANDWWTKTPDNELNDMYQSAYQAGYRTAFVNLGGPDGSETGSMWDNGIMLSRQLGAIALFYRVDTVDLIAHSKGGVDAETAVAHYGGWQKVRSVFTLGTPHYGDELADLLYSDWASWLARLLKLQNDATYTLQTGYMQVFRSLTDPKEAKQKVIYYRAAGTDMGPQFSGLWLTGVYLSQFGPNDGAVTVASTALPAARTLFIGPYTHFTIFLGHTALPQIDAALRDLDGHGPNERVYLPVVAANAGSEPPPPSSRSQMILRGGRLSGTSTESVPIESGALKVTFDLMVPDNTVTATLTTPDAMTRPLQVIMPNGNWFFGRLWHLVHSEDNPAPGQWVFTISSPHAGAFLLVTMIESPLQVTVQGWPQELMRPGDSLQLEVQTRHPAGQPDVRRVAGRVTRELPGSPGDNPILLAATGRTARARLPSAEGIYVVSASVIGEMPDGMPFERSFVRSVAAVTSDTLMSAPAWLDR